MTQLYNCNNPRSLTKCCDGKVMKIANPSQDDALEDFEICLPFGAKLYSSNGCLFYDPPTDAPPTGFYGKVVVKDGCIAGLERDRYTTAFPSIPVAAG